MRAALCRDLCQAVPCSLSLQIALAPYQHLEEDMKSLRQVLEMKNQQIHQQEKKIMELEKLVSQSLTLGDPVNLHMPPACMSA